MALSRPLQDWPLVLCGPILRRVDTHSVNVFVALKHARRILLQVEHVTDSGLSPVLSDETDSVQIGRYLHVAVVTVKAPDASLLLQMGFTYTYNLTFTKTVSSSDPTDTRPSVESLDDMDQFGLEKRISYANHRLPTFALPPDNINDLRLTHASCRKPHAHDSGHPDALPALDTLVEDSHQNPLQRPHQLFLTGDQIYADDVAPALFRVAVTVGVTALGWPSLETIPGVLEPSNFNPTGGVDTNHFDVAP